MKNAKKKKKKQIFLKIAYDKIGGNYVLPA